MKSLLPIDIIGLLHQDLLDSRRPEDGLLHCSSDLIGSLRHAQLRMAGAPIAESEFTQEVVLKTGNLWHEYIGEMLGRQGLPFMREVSATPWLPEGWAGTPDLLFWDPSLEGWVLADIKTAKGESFRFLRKDGAKEEHLWQLSAYYWALVEAGFPMVHGFSIIYIPKNNVPKEGTIEPIVADGLPLEKELVWDRMEERWAICKEYIEDTEGGILAPPMERIQKYFWNSKTEVFDVKLVPHWTTMFCPYDDSLCDCSTQGENKIGHWVWEKEQLNFIPYRDHETGPTVKPTRREVEKRYAKTTTTA